MSKLKGKEKEQSVSSKYVRVTRTQLIWRQFKKNKGAMVGLITLIIIILLTIASEFLWDYNTDIAGMNSSQRLLPPSFEHPFGTDHAGRSLLARVIYGSRYSLVIGLVAVAISLGVGTTIGAIAGYYGGLIESIIMRIVEMLLFVPSMIITIILVATFGINLENLILAFGLSTVPHFARNARAAVLTVRNNEYVEAAKALAASDFRIIFKHIIPNALSPILVQATTRIASCIVGAASFSFLGLGVPSPLPEWGAMLSDARPFMRVYPNLIIFPGLAIFITTLAINLIGDGLRDALDPKLKR